MSQTICPQCGHENPGTPLYCANCRVDMELAAEQIAKSQVTCPSCRSVVASDAYCSRCGIALSQSPMQQGPTQKSGIWKNLSAVQKGMIAVGGVILLFIIVMGGNRSARPAEENARPATSTQSPPPKAPEAATSPAPARSYSTMVQNLAIIEGAQNDDGRKARISSLLSQLDSRYPESEEQIGDMTAAAYNQIEKKGLSASIIGIMEAMMTASEAKTKTTYSDAVTAYILLRLGGMK